MKIWVYIVIGVIALGLISYALSAVVGIVVWLALAAAVGALIVGALRMGSGGDKTIVVADKREERKLDSAAERALKELERKVDAK
jgi:hypothetical protein